MGKSTEECTSRDQAGCNGEGLERNRRDLEIEPTMESNMKVSNRVLTMGPLMVAVNDLLVDASSSRLADEVDVTMMYLGLSLGVVLAVLGATVAPLIRKRRQLSSKMADAERSNRLTQLRFVREAF